MGQRSQGFGRRGRETGRRLNDDEVRPMPSEAPEEVVELRESSGALGNLFFALFGIFIGLVAFCIGYIAILIP